MSDQESSPSSSVGLTIGIVVGGVVVAVLVIGGILAALLVPAVTKVREAAARTQTMNNLKQIGLAMHSYHDTYNQLPPAVIFDPKGKPLYSWRVLLLPYLEEDGLFKQFKLDEPWDSPSNLPLLQRMPAVYMHPGAAKQDRTLTYFQVFDGPAGDERPRALFASHGTKRVPFKALFPVQKDLYQSDPVMKLANVADGSANTIMVVEAADGVPWTKPADLDFDPRKPLAKLGGHLVNANLALMCDASVRVLRPQDITEQTLRTAITIDGNDILGPDW